MFKQVPLSDFIPQLRTKVNVPLDPLMEDAILDAAIIFCRKSKIILHYRNLDFVYAMQTIGVVSNSAENRRAKGSIKSSGIITVKSGGNLLVASKDYHQNSLDELFFLNDFNDVQIISSIEPVKGATEISSVLLNDWSSGICAGAATALLIQPDMDWSNPQLSAYYEREFVESIREAAKWRREANPQITPPNLVRKRVFF